MNDVDNHIADTGIENKDNITIARCACNPIKAYERAPYA
jgi:hypothetical protein